MKKGKFILGEMCLILGMLFATSAIAGASPVDLYYRPEYLDLDWTAIKFFCAGAVLLFMELFIPGFGVCGISGLVCILVSFYFGLGGSKDTLPVLAVGVVLLLVVGGLLLKFLPQNPVWRLFMLKNKSEIVSPQEEQSRTSYLGKQGTTLSQLRPSGVAIIEGKRMDVLTEGEFIAANSSVIVVKEEGRKIFVEKREC